MFSAVQVLCIHNTPDSSESGVTLAHMRSRGALSLHPRSKGALVEYGSQANKGVPARW